MLSTPDDPAAVPWPAALDDAVRALLAHGTTVATNALLERRGAPVALVTTAGFARRDRDRPPGPPVALRPAPSTGPTPLVPRRGRLEVAGRLDATGGELEPVDPDAVPPMPAGTEAVAVCLLHADLDRRHERSVAARVARP